MTARANRFIQEGYVYRLTSRCHGERMVADAGVGDPMAGATLLVGDDGGAEACAQISGG